MPGEMPPCAQNHGNHAHDYCSLPRLPRGDAERTPLEYQKLLPGCDCWRNYHSIPACHVRDDAPVLHCASENLDKKVVGNSGLYKVETRPEPQHVNQLLPVRKTQGNKLSGPETRQAVAEGSV
jgi:hypothetical protein